MPHKGAEHAMVAAAGTQPVSVGRKLLVLCNARLGDLESGRGHDRDEVTSQDGHHHN